MSFLIGSFAQFLLKVYEFSLFYPSAKLVVVTYNSFVVSVLTFFSFSFFRSLICTVVAFKQKLFSFIFFTLDDVIVSRGWVIF